MAGMCFFHVAKRSICLIVIIFLLRQSHTLLQSCFDLKLTFTYGSYIRSYCTVAEKNFATVGCKKVNVL